MKKKIIRKMKNIFYYWGPRPPKAPGSLCDVVALLM